MTLSQREELFWLALHSGRDGGLFAGTAFHFLLSIPSFFFSFLLSFCFLFLLPSSLRFVFKTELGKDAPGWQSCRWHGGYLGSIRGLWTRVKHLHCAQKPQNRSAGEGKTQKPTKPVASRKPRFFLKNTPIAVVSKNMKNNIFGSFYLPLICISTVLHTIMLLLLLVQQHPYLLIYLHHP